MEEKIESKEESNEYSHWVRRSTRKRTALFSDEIIQGCGTTRSNNKGSYDSSDDESIEDDAQLKSKIESLCSLIRECNGSICVFTGAGISKNAGLQTYRGKGGLWVSKKRSNMKASIWFPTLTHRALSALIKANVFNCLITQNCDDLHNIAGDIPEDKLVEIHGNCFKEKCTRCGSIFVRDFVVSMPTSPSVYQNYKKRQRASQSNEEPESEEKEKEEEFKPPIRRRRRRNKNISVNVQVINEAIKNEQIINEGIANQEIEKKTEKTMKIKQNESMNEPDENNEHLTGRLCERCQGKLRDIVVNFGESIRRKDWEKALQFGKSCKLTLVLGSSLKVSPTNQLAQQSEKLVICNLQRTALHEEADIILKCSCDTLMQELMNSMQIPIPDYIFKFTFLLCLDKPRKKKRAGTPETFKLSLQLPSGKTLNIIKELIIDIDKEKSISLNRKNRFRISLASDREQLITTLVTAKIDSSLFLSKLTAVDHLGKSVTNDKVSFPYMLHYYINKSNSISTVELLYNTTTGIWSVNTTTSE